jgi:hypothetical protein
MARYWSEDENGNDVIVETTFAERKAARKAAGVGGKCVFEVRADGEVIATFVEKKDAVAFTKSSEVYSEEFGWQIKPSSAAIKTGCFSDPFCTIKAVMA